MRRSFFAALVACAVLALAGTSYGQGGSSSTISGVVPGANVVVKHSATGISQTGVTNSQGVFSFPGLNVGTYTVTVSMPGVQTVDGNRQSQI